MAKAKKPRKKPYRRRLPKPDAIWDYLNATAQQSYSYLAIPRAIIPLIRNSEIWEKLKETPEEESKARLLVTAVGNNTESSVQELETITQKHAGRKGSSKNVDEALTGLGIGEEYLNWAFQFESAVINNITDLIEIVSRVAPNDPEVAEVISQIQLHRAERQRAEAEHQAKSQAAAEPEPTEAEETEND